MQNISANRLSPSLIFAAAVGCLMKFACGGIIDGACGTGANKSTGEKVKHSKFLSDSDMFNSAYDLPAASKTVHYEVNCKDGYIRTCSASSSSKTKDRPDAAVCKATLTDKSPVTAKDADVTKGSAVKGKTSDSGKDLTGVETVQFSDRSQYAKLKGMLSCTLTCHCFAAADLDCN